MPDNRSTLAAAALVRMSRRDMLGFAARGATSVVVSQSVFACSAADTTSATSGVDTSVAAGSANSSCVLTAALTEGPYFVDEKLARSDIRSDPATGIVSAGVPLTLRFNVSRVDSNACTPLTGAYLDVWHCDAGGLYSDESANGTSGRRYLRGYQITGADGGVDFTTIYPGWYSGRAVHIHFKLRLYTGATQSYAFTSQFFFDETLTSVVHAQSPYSNRGARDTRNTTDGIYNSLSTTDKSALTLQASATAAGYAGIINLGVKVG